MNIYPLTLLIQYICLALGIIFTKNVVMQASVFFATGTRSLFAFIVLAGMCRKAKTSLLDMFRDIPLYLISGALFRMFLPWALIGWSLQHVTAVKYALLNSFAPFITAVLCWVILSEKITKIKILGLLIGSCGIIPILMVKSAQEINFMSQLYSLSLPEIGLLLGIASMCYGWVEMKKLLTLRPEISEIGLRAYDVLLSGIAALVVAILFESKWLYTESISLFIGTQLAVVLFTTIFGNNLYAWHVRRLSPVLLSLASLSRPFFVALFIWLWYGEPVGLELYCSTGLILIGSIIFYKEEISGKLQTLKNNSQN